MEVFFKDGGKLDLYSLLKRRYPLIKNTSSVLFIECTEMDWKKTDSNFLCVSILLRNMGWYLGVIGNI